MTLAPSPDGAINQLDKLHRAAQNEQQTRAQSLDLKYTAAILADDLWFNGRGWNGPMPKGENDNPDSQRAALEVQGEVHRTFVSRNLTSDVVARHAHGIAGKVPLWSVLPRGVDDKAKLTGQDKAHAEEYTAALATWLEEAGGWRTVQQMLFSGIGLGIGITRLYIHRSKLVNVDGGYTTPSPDTLDLTSAAKLISIMEASYTQAGVLRDTEGHVIGAYYRYKNESGHDRLELHERIPDGVRIYPEYVAGQQSEFVEYPVSDTLIWEMRQKALVTKSMRSLQRMLDKTFTMGSRNIDLGGFVERLVLNAQMPGYEKKVKDATGFEKTEYVRSKLYWGAGVTNNFNGLPIKRLNPDTNKEEITAFTTPSVLYKDPVSFETFTGSINQAREAIYDEAKQLHVLISGDASASGVSRQQAVNDFLNSLETTKHSLEQMFRWLMGAVLDLALHFMGRTGEARGWRISVQPRTSATQPTPTDVATALSLHESGTISEEEFASRIGIEDWTAEKQRRAEEGITPAIAMKLLDKGLPTWVHLQALSLVFPALGITPADVERQKELDLGGSAVQAQPFTNPTDNTLPRPHQLPTTETLR